MLNQRQNVFDKITVFLIKIKPKYTFKDEDGIVPNSDKKLTYSESNTNKYDTDKKGSFRSLISSSKFTTLFDIEHSWFAPLIG